MKVADVTLNLHEQLRNMDLVWLKRCLTSIVGENKACWEADNAFCHLPDKDGTIPLMLGKHTSGVVLLFSEMFAPMMAVHSILLTKDPKFLMVSNDQSFDDAPFRISFLAHDWDVWESSSVERLDQLSPAMRHSPLRSHAWLVTLLGSQPLPRRNAESKILPRLKLGIQPPNFDFTKLRQNLIDNTDDVSRIRLLKGLHEKLWHELHAGMERFLSRLGVPDRCYELIDTVIQTCDHCNAFTPVPRRPQFGAQLAGHFGDVLIIHLFYLWNMQFMLMIDEALRYTVSALCHHKNASTLG